MYEKGNNMEVSVIAHMGTDLSVVNAARVSYGKKSKALTEKDIKLIKYLAEHKHWTPFAHTAITFHIKAPMFVARQLGKHQIGLVWNEISRRYVSDEADFYEPDTWRGKPEKSKQGSSDEKVNINPHSYIFNHYQRYIMGAKATYEKLLKQGVAPELARMALPQSMYTEWYWTGSVHAFSRVCNLRLQKDVQEETQLIVKKIFNECWSLFPISWGELCQSLFEEDNYDEEHIGCYSWPNCDVDPQGCDLSGYNVESYGHRG